MEVVWRSRHAMLRGHPLHQVIYRSQSGSTSWEPATADITAGEARFDPARLLRAPLALACSTSGRRCRWPTCCTAGCVPRCRLAGFRRCKTPAARCCSLVVTRRYGIPSIPGCPFSTRSSWKPDADDPMIHTPAVLLPSMLRYSQGRVIANKYANTPAPRCSCVICKGASLDRFDSLSGQVRATAHAHNAAVWTSWLSDLFGHATDSERQLWWRGICQAPSMHTSTRTRGCARRAPSSHLPR